MEKEHGEEEAGKERGEHLDNDFTYIAEYTVLKHHIRAAL